MVIQRQIYRVPSVQDILTEDSFRYCPMCGHPLEQKTIDQRTRRFCPNCGFIHFRNPAPTVSLLIVDADRALLGKRAGNPGKGQWATPSGYIEYEEDFLTTAVREAKEETGLQVEIISILNVTDSFLPPRYHFFNVYLLARAVGGELQAGDDMSDLAWFPIGGPLPEMAFQEDIDLIGHFRRKPKGGEIAVAVWK